MDFQWTLKHWKCNLKQTETFLSTKQYQIHSKKTKKLLTVEQIYLLNKIQSIFTKTIKMLWKFKHET